MPSTQIGEKFSQCTSTKTSKKLLGSVLRSFSEGGHLVLLFAIVGALPHNSTKLVSLVSVGHNQTTSFINAPKPQAVAAIRGGSWVLSLSRECEER
jgi:hypothetical protein